MSGRLNGRRILVVEDDSLTRLDVCTVLRREGAKVSYAKYLSQGLQLVADDTVDAAVCDLRSPDHATDYDDLHSQLESLYGRGVAIVIHTPYNLHSADFSFPVRVVRKPANLSKLIEAVV